MDSGITREQLIELCSKSIQFQGGYTNDPRITLSRTGGGRMPLGWPRGELLSVSHTGIHNYSYKTLKVLAWVFKNMKRVTD